MSTSPLAPEQLEALRNLDTCEVSNAIEKFNVRLRNEGFSNASIRCLFPALKPMLGYAATLKVRFSDPPVEGHHYTEHTNWWDHISSMPGPRVVAIQDIGPTPAAGAFIGEVHASILRALGCVGALTNGAVRDLPALEALRFQTFAGAVSVSHAYMHLVEIGGAVEIAGLKIHPRDLLLGDCHGIVSIPAELAGSVPGKAAQISNEEKRITDLCRSKDFSVEKLRTLIRELREPVR